MDCRICTDKLKPEEALKCSLCHGSFHYSCIGLSELEFKKILPMNKPKWKCPECKQLKKTSSPLIQSKTDHLDIASLIEHMDKKFDSLSKNLSDFKTSINGQLDTLTKTVNSWEERIRQLEVKQTSLTEISSTLKSRDLEIPTLQSTVNSLRDQLNSQEQHCLRNELEISGITETENESLQHVVSIAAMKIGISVNESEIDMITRVGPKLKPSQLTPESRPRPVVVRFLRNKKRNEMLSAARSRKNLSTADLDLQGPPQKLFFNERLTKVNRKLFREARIRATQTGYKYCWVKNGLIFVRKEDQKPPKNIRTTDDIDRIMGPDLSDSNPK